MKNIKYYEKLEDFLEANKNSKAKFFLLVAQNFPFDFEKLKNSNLDFHGVFVPQIIFNESYSDKKMIACELDESVTTLFFENMDCIDIQKEQVSKYDSIMVLVDGFSKNITAFLESIFQVLPMDSEIIGAGVGKLDLPNAPSIFSSKGMFQNAALILAGNSTLSVGVENGWDFLEGPFIVTSAQENILKSLNFTNAFEVYKKIVEKNSALKFNDNNFLEIAKTYPLGIVKFNNEIIVRDPIKIDENKNIVLIGDIEQNSTINILVGRKEKVIKSSFSSAVKALKKIEDINNIKNIILFDCISRAGFLKEDFKEELHQVKKAVQNKNIFGALTLGEIANNGNEYINFYNKTCVVGALC